MNKYAWKAIEDSFRNFRGAVWNPKDKATSANSKVAYALAESCRMFEYIGLPETIPSNEFELILQTTGCAYRPTEGEPSEYVFWGTEGGEPNPYYHPSEAIITNPALDLSEEYEIDKNVIEFRNDSLKQGMLPLYTRYATELAENELTLFNVTVLSRAIYAILAKDDAQAAAANRFLEALQNGDLAVITGNQDWMGGEGISIVPTGDNPYNLIKSLIEREQYLAATWRNAMGLQANWNSKREATNEAEAGMGDDALIPLVYDMLKCREEACAKWNNANPERPMFVKLSSAWERRMALANAEAGTDIADDGKEDGNAQEDPNQISISDALAGAGTDGTADDSAMADDPES